MCLEHATDCLSLAHLLILCTVLVVVVVVLVIDIVVCGAVGIVQELQQVSGDAEAGSGEHVDALHP